MCTELRASKFDARSTHRHILSQTHRSVRPVGARVARAQIYAGLGREGGSVKEKIKSKLDTE